MVPIPNACKMWLFKRRSLGFDSASQSAYFTGSLFTIPGYFLASFAQNDHFWRSIFHFVAVFQFRDAVYSQTETDPVLLVIANRVSSPAIGPPRLPDFTVLSSLWIWDLTIGFVGSNRINGADEYCRHCSPYSYSPKHLCTQAKFYTRLQRGSCTRIPSAVYMILPATFFDCRYLSLRRCNF
jgi:hypothetical protein